MLDSDAGTMAKESKEMSGEEVRAIQTTVLSLPRAAIVDLLSIGVCGRCIFRLFGIQSSSCYSSSIHSDSLLHSLLEGASDADNVTQSNGSSAGSERCTHPEGEKSAFCCVCLGILQLAFCNPDVGTFMDKTRDREFEMLISDFVRREGHQMIEGFSLEISLPPVILANERAIRLYMKKKYGSEGWFQENFLRHRISVKDALKLTITNSTEILLGAKSGVASFCIRLTYSHAKASSKLRSLACKDGHVRKRWKIGAHCSLVNTDDSNAQIKKKYTEESAESDAIIRRAIETLQDDEFCEHLNLPPEKVDEPCCLTFQCYRMPIYVGGRYLKYSRKVSQTRWIIDEERMGDASAEEIIGSNVLPICKGDSIKFHAAGREDIDVRMLGSGRPFLVEIQNARHIPTSVDLEDIVNKISNSKDGHVKVRNLNLVGIQAWNLMREGEAEKQKQYAAIVWISRPLDDEDLQKISSLKDVDILQKTPIRVLHRRSPLERKRIIHWMNIERIVGSCQYFLLHLCTQAGTYIKEFVHGDLGRTHPSIGSILGCKAEILQLDVTDVKMDLFN